MGSNHARNALDIRHLSEKMADTAKNIKGVRRGTKRKQKGFYVANKKKKYGKETLTAGIQGVLITCEGKEKMCVRESYDLLNEYADKLYGKEEYENQRHDSGEEESEEDIESAIAKEVENIKNQKQRRFKAVFSGANNVVFIKCTLPEEKDPVELVHNLLTDIATSATKKTRFCMRFLPVSATCYAKLDEIKKVVGRLAYSYFLADDVKPAKFCVMYKNRNNSDMHRNDVITAIASLVLSSGKGHSVDLRNPDYAICVEIVKTICCISIVKDYFTLKKYNIQELVPQKPAVAAKEDTKIQQSPNRHKPPSSPSHSDEVESNHTVCESSGISQDSKIESNSNCNNQNISENAKAR